MKKNGCFAVAAVLAELCLGVAGAAPVIKAEKKPWGTDYTLVSSDGSGDVTLVSVKPSCTKYASQMANMYSDDTYGVGVRAWDLRDEMVMTNGELKVVVPGGRAGATASVIEGPRESLPGRFAEAGRAHGATMSEHGGPMALSSDGARLSYMFAEVTTASCEDYIELARRGGLGIVHFHNWWSSLGHYPVNTNYFPGGFADLVAAAGKVHAAGLKVGMHTLSGCIDFNDPCLVTDAVRDLQHVARYTLAADLAADATELAVRERPIGRHDRVMTYSGYGNVVRIGTELVQYDDYTTEPPYVFKGLRRRWLGSRGGAHKAGEHVDYLRQRYLSFYPQPGTPLADDVAVSIARTMNACKADQVYFDGSEGMGSPYNIAWMRKRLFSAIGRSVYVEASHMGAHNWYFHSRLNAWDYPNWNLNAFSDMHFRLNSNVRKADLLAPQMGWWAPLMSREGVRGHLREEMEYVAGKTVALDASFAISGVEEAYSPPPWLRLDHITILGWYESLRTRHAFSDEAIARLSVPGDEFRLRQGNDGAWRLRSVKRTTHRISGAGTDRWSIPVARSCPAALRIETLYGADESGDSVTLLPAGRFPARKWEYPYLDAKGRGAFVFDVNGDGSGRTLVLTVKSPREFTAAISEHRVKIDFKGWRRVTVLARERDAAPGGPVKLRYPIYRCPLKLDHISEAFFSWDGGVDAPPLEIGEVKAFPLSRVAADHPVLAVGRSRLEVPFRLEAGESAELEGDRWTRYSETGDPLACVQGTPVVLDGGETAFEWHAPVRAEVILTELGESVDALKPGADSPDYVFARPQLYAPSRGFDAPFRIAVARGDRRRPRLEILGAIDRPAVSVGGVAAVFPVNMRKGDRLICRDGKNWTLRDQDRKMLASGTLERPFPVLDATADVKIACRNPAAADVRVLVSTRRAERAAPETSLSSAPDPETVFRNPPQSAKTGVWWHWMGCNVTKDGIVKDLDWFRDMGVGAATIFGMADVCTPWATSISNSPTSGLLAFTPEWWRLVRFACEEAEKRGVEIGVHNCPGYTSTGGPWIPPRLAMRQLVFNVTNAESQISLPAHAACPVWHGATGKICRPDIQSRRTDLREIAVVDGIRVQHIPMGAYTQPNQWEVFGLECDKMNPEAVNLHLDRVISDMRKYVGDQLGRGLKFVLLDSYEAGRPTWTPNMREEFTKRRGYDPLPFLPILGGFKVKAAPDARAEAKFKADFDRTVKDLYRDVLFKTMREKLNAAGLEFACEPYEGPFDSRECATHVDRLMTEFWVNSREMRKGLAPQPLGWNEWTGPGGRRHNVVEAEAFTGQPEDCQWTETPYLLKRVADYQFCRGVNRMTLHTCPLQPWGDEIKPGKAMGRWGTHFGRNQTWAQSGKGFFTYMNRCQALLQWGVPGRAQLAVGNVSPAGSRVSHICREADGKHVLFVANLSSNAVSMEATPPACGNSPEWFDPVSGRISLLPVAGGKISIGLPPYGSGFVVLRRSVASKAVPADRFGTLFPIDSAWRVSFGDFNAEMPTLEDWTSSADPRIRYFSGTAVYRTTFRIDAAALSGKGAFRLSLGDCNGQIARVVVNGRDVGTFWCEPYEAPVPRSALHEGENSLEIEFTNVWANRLIGDEQEPPDCEFAKAPMVGGWYLTRFPDWFAKGIGARPSKGRKCFTDWNYFTKDSALTPSGLLGPVRLMAGDSRH